MPVPLQKISIPSTVESLGDFCFQGCGALHEVWFGTGSQLRAIGEGAFQFCAALKQITLPSTVETIRKNCFAFCKRLLAIELSPSSKLARIESRAFANCSCLRSFAVPASVVFIGTECFLYCPALVDLTFEAPSNLKELLNVPLPAADRLEIPDSVEVFSVARLSRGRADRLILFGRESRLRSITGRVGRDCPPRCFLQAASRTLKALRDRMEFQGCGHSNF
jgi:hypothetical protein